MQQPKSNRCVIDKYFKITERGSSIRQELIAGVTLFLAMVYSVIVVPGMLGQAGFDPSTVFISTCLVAGFGSILMGLWANLPLAIGCAISLTAFVAFDVVLGKGIPIPVALGAAFIMGIVFTIISVTGIRQWLLRNLPINIAHGTGVGIGLFLFLIAASGVGIITKSVSGGTPVAFGDFTSFPVMISLIGLVMIIGLERLKVPGAILIVIVVISIIGLCVDPAVKYTHLFSVPSFVGKNGVSSFFTLDIHGALQPIVLPIVFSMIMMVIFDATGTIRAVTGQVDLIDEKGDIINGGKALTSDSVSTIFASLIGASPAAVYIESAAATAAGGRTGLVATVVGILFLIILFFSPIAYLVPAYATAPALMYVGLLMFKNIVKLDFTDFIGTMSALLTAIFIVMTNNIVTGIMIGFASLVIGRLIGGEWRKLNVGIVIIAIVLVAFYVSGYAI